MLRYDTFLNRKIITSPATYPYVLTLPNKGFEDGVMTPWATMESTLGAIYNNPATAHSGTYYAVIAAASALPAWGQILDIPSELNTDIDDGLVKLSFSAWLSSFASDSDSGRFRCLFQDGSGNFICDASIMNLSDPNTWTEYTFDNILVPEGARKVAIGVMGNRVTGTELSAYVDDFSDIEFDLTGLSHETIYRTEPVSGDLTDWTLTGGSWYVSGTGDYGWNRFGRSSASTLSATKTIPIPAGRLAAVAAGTAHLHSMFTMSRGVDNDSDTGNFLVEFLDASNNVVGSHTTGSSVNYSRPGSLGRWDDTIPVDATQVRLTMSATRGGGSNVDAPFKRACFIIES